MSRSTAILGILGVVSIIFYRTAKNFFNSLEDPFIYSFDEQDIVSDLPGARLHLETPAL